MTPDYYGSHVMDEGINRELNHQLLFGALSGGLLYCLYLMAIFLGIGTTLYSLLSLLGFGGILILLILQYYPIFKRPLKAAPAYYYTEGILFEDSEKRVDFLPYEQLSEITFESSGFLGRLIFKGSEGDVLFTSDYYSLFPFNPFTLSLSQMYQPLFQQVPGLAHLLSSHPSHVKSLQGFIRKLMG